jgi:hypothetical protein
VIVLWCRVPLHFYFNSRFETLDLDWPWPSSHSLLIFHMIATTVVRPVPQDGQLHMNVIPPCLISQQESRRKEHRSPIFLTCQPLSRLRNGASPGGWCTQWTGNRTTEKACNNHHQWNLQPANDFKRPTQTEKRQQTVAKLPIESLFSLHVGKNLCGCNSWTWAQEPSNLRRSCACSARKRPMRPTSYLHTNRHL